MQGCPGSQAVHTLGTGALRNVRAAHLRSTQFWFEVDSAWPGLPQRPVQAAWMRSQVPSQGPAKARMVLSSDGRALIRQRLGAGEGGETGEEGQSAMMLAGGEQGDAILAKAKAWDGRGKADSTHAL